VEEAFFFESAGHRLFAMAHGLDQPAAGVGVVVCHPYGEEKQLSYPVLVRFARLLARAGFPVLRFDSCGYGDSEGVLEDATVETQIADTLVAARLARERLKVDGIVFLGLRLGTSIAARAAERLTAAGLILWCPIVNGRQYVDEMLRKKVFAEILAKRRISRQEVLEELAREGRVEIEGNFLTRQMSEEIGTIDLMAEVSTFRQPVFVSALKNHPNGYASYEGLTNAYASHGAPCEFAVAGARPFWERDAMYDQYYPQDLFERTQRWMQAQRWIA
jgi:alpha/beta superfamily hydrolase